MHKRARTTAFIEASASFLRTPCSSFSWAAVLSYRDRTVKWLACLALNSAIGPVAPAASGASTRHAKESLVGLPLQVLSNNLPRMPRWYLFLASIVLPAIAFACNDETIQEVDQSVCFSGKQWIGDKRGDPRMFPGRDCVGCHLDNDGPELMLGGTVYPFVQAAYDDAAVAKFKQQQTGKDCFGLEGVKMTITGGDG